MINVFAYTDLNHEGKLDLIASATRANALIVLSGKGDGTFQPPVAYATGASPESIGIVPSPTGETMLITSDGISRALWFTFVSAQGQVGAPQIAPVGGRPTSMVAGDLNGDGIADVVVTGAANNVSVLLGQTSGDFKAPVGYSLGQPSPQPKATVVGDLNGDGKPDLVIGNAGQSGQPGSVSVLLGNAMARSAVR